MGIFRDNHEFLYWIISGYNHERFDIFVQIDGKTISFTIHTSDVKWLTGLPYKGCEVISSKQPLSDKEKNTWRKFFISPQNI